MVIAVASPWLLGFLAVLPLIWLLLRLTPPAPKRVVFPALSLLYDLVHTRKTPARTPWWLLLLRLFTAAVMIVAMAHPLLDPEPSFTGAGATLIAVDNDWAAARDWNQRQETLAAILNQAERQNRDVILLPTAPPADGAALESFGPFAATTARAYVSRLSPQPWPSDWKKAVELLRQHAPAAIDRAVWLNGGLGGPDAEAFAAALRQYPALTILSDADTTPLYLLAPPSGEGDTLNLTVARAARVGPDIISVNALDADGASLAQIPVVFKPNELRAQQPLNLPLDRRNKATRFVIEGTGTAASTVLLDESWRRRPVGLVGDKGETEQTSLLGNLFYLERALAPFVDLRTDAAETLLAEPLAVLILTDSPLLRDSGIAALKDWIRRGGVLVRFAGDQLAASTYAPEKELLPVPLRTGNRALGGALSWATPQALRAFPEHSPFHGLAQPSDVTVTRQLLAEPTADLAERTWAALQDGTPLVTARPMGQGLSILFHVPAQATWSNLPLSGLFVAMLRRIVDLSHGVGAAPGAAFETLAPYQTLDAFGTLQPPSPAVRPLAKDAQPGPSNPPGYYGPPQAAHAFDLGEALAPPFAFHDPAAQPYRTTQQEHDLQPALLTLALLLLLGDFLLSLHLRGLTKRSAASLILIALVSAHPAAAAPSEKAAIDFTAKTWLAYVITGDRATDSVSEAGLKSLARVLQRRTTMEQIGVTGIDPSADELAFFPLIYWPLGNAAPAPQAAQRVNDYLRHGGMILFDLSRDGPLSAAVSPDRLKGIALPPLVQMPQDHVLRRSFYLLDDFPGRFTGADLWIEPEQNAAYDNVASVLVGSHGWAAAWATDAGGQPLFPCVPGGEAQRERAYRFGINLVMYALTGNYKADQLHAKALLEREP